MFPGNDENLKLIQKSLLIYVVTKRTQQFFKTQINLQVQYATSLLGSN